MEAVTGLLDIAVHHAVYGHRRHPHSLNLTRSDSPFHCFTALCRCEVYDLLHTHTVVLVHRRSRSHTGVRRLVAAFHLSRGIGRAAWWKGTLTSCTGVREGEEEPRVGGWTRVAGASPWGGK